MISTRIRAIPQPNGRSFPSNILHFGQFKRFLNNTACRLGLPQRFKPRLYTYADYIFVKLYALITNKSTYRASDDLNKKCTRAFFQKVHQYPKQFADLKRKRRFVPNQSDVDKFFRILSKKDCQILFGNMNMRICEKIVTQIGRGQRWRVLIDNTEYPYYGKTATPYEIGSNRHKGTRKMRLFQGHSLQASDITLFYDFLLLKKGQYRSKDIPLSVKWLRWNRISISYALMDREFYRAALLKKLKNDHLPVIIPAKKFQQVQHRIRQFLLGNGPLVSSYIFKQAPKTRPWPSSLHLNVVIVGHKDQPAWIIREQFRKNQMTWDEAYSKLSAFFTTVLPWKDEKRWSRWLTQTYKKRWNQETGFSKLNCIHDQFRYRFPVVQLAELHLRGLIYNTWQFYRHQQKRMHVRVRDLTIKDYTSRIRLELEKEVIASAFYNAKYLQERKKRVYFNT